MPCLVALIALFFPRLAIILLVIFSDYIGRGFGGAIVLPFLGFLFMPFTTLAYALAQNAAGAVSGIYLVIVIIAVLLDIGSWGGGAATHRRTVVVRRR